MNKGDKNYSIALLCYQRK